MKVEKEKELSVEVANMKKMKGGPVYKVGGSIDGVYNPCGVICQNAALSSCNRFFSNKATVETHLKDRNCLKHLDNNTVLDTEIHRSEMKL